MNLSLDPSQWLPGRGWEIIKVRTLLAPEGARVVLTGLPGVGKTTFIQRFLHLYQSEFPNGIAELTCSPDGRDRISALDRVPSLVAFDAKGSPDHKQLSAFLKEAREYPDLRVLCGSQSSMTGVLGGTYYVEMEPFDPEDFVELARRMTALERQWQTVQPESESNPLLAFLLTDYVRAGVDISRLYVEHDVPRSIFGIDEADESFSNSELNKIELEVVSFGDSLLEKLSRNPNLMHSLSPRRFEELVAELYEREGFSVELTSVTRDDGVDIYAVRSTPFGSFLTLIDCKRFREDRGVEVGLVRQLYGTVEAKKASVGVIATTSFFTKGARKFQGERPYRLGLQDFLAVTGMLRRAINFDM